MFIYRAVRINQNKTRSLRHASVMFGLVNRHGIDSFLLARNAGTSAEMIDRLHARPLSAAMRLDMLHSTKRTPVAQR